jgi:hypothetical protein
VSTSPGNNVAPPRSTSLAPSGGSAPASTDRIVGPSNTTSGSATNCEPTPSNSHAARIAVSPRRSVTVS